MKIIRTKQNYIPSKGETPKGISLTVPDESYSVQEMLERHARGLGFGNVRVGQWDDLDEEEHDAIDMNQYQNMDITEKGILHSEMGEIREKFEKEKKKKKAENEAKKGEKVEKLEKPQE